MVMMDRWWMGGWMDGLDGADGPVLGENGGKNRYCRENGGKRCVVGSA